MLLPQGNQNNAECVVLIKDGVSLISRPNQEEIKNDFELHYAMKKEKKYVKGVEESIFDLKYEQLVSYLDSIYDDQWVFINGKKKANYYKHDRKTKRRSGYRGVSRNGASWQVLMMINNVKTYIG